MSGELPGANPTMIRTWSCAQAKRETAGSASAPAAILKNARRGSVIESSQYRYQLSLRDAQDAYEPSNDSAAPADGIACRPYVMTGFRHVPSAGGCRKSTSSPSETKGSKSRCCNGPIGT